MVRELQRDDHLGTDGGERVWHFRIERHDASGDRLLPVPVELRGLTFTGTVSNGDEVRVDGRWRHGTLRVSTLDNLTTGAAMHTNPHPVARAVGCGVFAIFFLGMFGFLAMLFVQNVILERSWP